MSRLYVIADTHFGHKKLALVRGYASVEDHDRDLIARWNAVVNKKDVVYHLGDAAFGSKALEAMKGLNGLKKLAMGNHDQQKCSHYLEVFTQYRACYEVDNMLLTHIPVDKGQSHRYKLNVHGHSHAHSLSDPWYVCVSVEQINLTPVLLSTVTNGREQKPDFVRREAKGIAGQGASQEGRGDAS